MKLKNIVVNTLVFEELIKKGVSQSELLDDIYHLGIKKVEVRREYINDKSEKLAIKEKAKSLGIELFYSIPDLLFENELMPEEKLYQFFEEANELNARHIKFTAGYTRKITKESKEVLNKFLHSNKHIKVTIENDQNVYSTGKKMNQLVQRLKENDLTVGYTFDVGNFIYVNEDPLENAHLLKDSVTYLHLKNVNKKGQTTTALDDGQIDIDQVLSVFPVNVNKAIEFPCGDNPISVLEKEINNFKNEESA